MSDQDHCDVNRLGVAGLTSILAPTNRGSPNVATEAPKTVSVAPTPRAAERSSGSAYAVDGKGNVLTNNHVVEGCRTLVLRRGASIAPAELVAADEHNDLAVIKSDLPNLQAVKFRDGRGIRAGDSVVAMGYPYAGLLSTSPQTTTGTVTALAGIGDDSRFLQITAPVQPGNSGGPLFDASGNVVGTVVATLDALVIAKATGSIPQNVNFAIKSGIVRAFLDSKGISYATATSAVGVEPADISEIGAKSLVMVECTK